MAAMLDVMPEQVLCLSQCEGHVTKYCIVIGR